MIKFENNYCTGSKTWHLMASRGDIGYGMGWLECRPTRSSTNRSADVMETSLNRISYNLARAPSTKQTNGYPDGGPTFDWGKRVYSRSKKRQSAK